MVDHLTTPKNLLNYADQQYPGNLWIPEHFPYFKEYIWYLTLSRKIKDLPIDIIHNATQFYTRGKFRQKYIMTCMDTIPYTHPTYMNPLTRLYGRLLPGCAKSADQIICISKNTEKDLVRIVPETKGKTAVVYPGINRMFQPGNRTRREDLILYVGSIDPRKNVPVLIKAFSELTKNTTLCIVGKLGWNHRPVMDIARDYGVAGRVMYGGYLSYAATLSLYQKATMLVYPSLYEGFGLPPVEAMACGCPVIASNTSSLPEAVGDAGILVDPTVDNLKESMRVLLDDPSLRREYSRAGILRGQMFQWPDKAKQIEEVYRSVLE